MSQNYQVEFFLLRHLHNGLRRVADKEINFKIPALAATPLTLASRGKPGAQQGISADHAFKFSR